MKTVIVIVNKSVIIKDYFKS